MDSISTNFDLNKYFKKDVIGLNFFNYFGFMADIIGMVSFVISIPTLIFAKSANKAVEEFEDKQRFKKEIGEHLKTLNSLYKSMSEDELYNESILNNLNVELDSLKINYPIVIRRFCRDMDALDKLIEETTPRLASTPKYNKAKISRKLHEIIERLKKEAKIG